MKAKKREMRLICIHAPPVTETWIHYTEYLADLLGAELVYRHAPEKLRGPTDPPMGQDVILVHEAGPGPWQRALGRTASERLATRGPSSTLTVRRMPWPIATILLILRSESIDEAAMAWAGTLARLAGAAVTVLPILPPIPALYTRDPAGWPEVGQWLAAKSPAVERVRSLLKQYRRLHMPVKLRLGRGDPVWQMYEETARAEYDIAIIGAESGGRLRRFLIGDLVGPLLRCAACPVFVAHSAPGITVGRAGRPAFQTDEYHAPVPAL